jgi:predicted nucleotide-binding protein
MLEVSIPVAYELLAQCIKQGQALVQRASLVGDFSDYESWKAARKQWIDPTAQALAHMYDGPREARDFAETVTCPDGGKRWQDQYAADLDCVKRAIDLLTLLQGELAIDAHRPAPPNELAAGDSAAEHELAAPQSPAYENEAAGPESHGYENEPDGPESHSYENALAGSQSAGYEQPGSSPEPSPQPAAPATTTSAGAAPETREIERAEMAAAATEQVDVPFAVGSELAAREPPLGNELAAPHDGAISTERLETSATSPVRTRRVLLAHGRDKRWAQAVARLLEQAGSHELTVLDNRSEHRAALLERGGEQDGATRYAVVLLTADDIGGPRLESAEEPYFAPRAHQEVVFEMGFLAAALTPARVCVLYEEGVELPCELDGISLVRLDLAGTWQPKLLMKLRGAGFDYDLNRLVSV